LSKGVRKELHLDGLRGRKGRRQASSLHLLAKRNGVKRKRSKTPKPKKRGLSKKPGGSSKRRRKKEVVLFFLRFQEGRKVTSVKNHRLAAREGKEGAGNIPRVGRDALEIEKKVREKGRRTRKGPR